jgi:hypothetical protein
MPNAMAGKLHRFDMRRRIERFSDTAGITFRDALLSELIENGGDFQNAEFTADTVLRIERRAAEPNGKGYRVHVWERELSTLPHCADLVNAEAYVCDFMGDE